MNNITIAIFDRLSPVEDPISLRTPALEILLDKPNPENSNQSTVAEALGAKVSLPPVNDLNLTKAEIDNLNAEVSKLEAIVHFLFGDTRGAAERTSESHKRLHQISKTNFSYCLSESDQMSERPKMCRIFQKNVLGLF